MLTFETLTPAFVLSRNRFVTWGLLGAILFLVGITPLGLEEVPERRLGRRAFLPTKQFPTDLGTVLRGHRRRQRRRKPTTAHVATPPPPADSAQSRHVELPPGASTGADCWRW